MSYDREALKKELTRDEGCKLEAYQDSLGWWTIGVGHNMGGLKRILSITQAESDAFLDMDIRIAEQMAQRFYPQYVNFDDVRQRALINMVFNLGGKILNFHNFRDAIARADWVNAGLEMVNSRWYTQVGDRAVRLRQMIETGVAA